MVTNALVALPSEARAAGWNLWDAIHSSPDLQVTALFWAQFDEDDWRIYLASPRVAAEGQRVIYRQLQQIMDKLPEEDLHGLELSDIVVTTPDDRVVREMGPPYGAGEGDRRTIRRLSLSAEEAYVYHLE